MASRDLHPELSPEERKRLIWEGIERFNRRAFFEAHESWEEVWRSTTPEPRDLFQGLIQLAAGMHHFLDRGRPEVARRVLAKGRWRLEGCAAACGLDLAELLAAVGRWESWLGAAEGPPPPFPEVRVLDPGAVH